MSRISGLKTEIRVERALVVGSFSVYHRVVADGSGKRGGSVTEEAITRIRERITSGVWGPWTKLPREADLAADLGPEGVRVNAISAGPVRTLSASGVRDFRKLYGTFAGIAPLRSNITAEDVGKTAVWLASDLSSAVTGEVVYVDGGFNVMGVPLIE